MNILLTAIGGPSAICFAKSLQGSPGVRLIGVNAEDDSIGTRFIDGFIRIPLASDPKYLDTMRRLVADERIDYIIPFVDEELVALCDADLGCQVLISPETTIRYTNDKGLAYDVLEDFLPERRTKKDAVFPIFAKPRIGRGGKGALLVRSAEELSSLTEDRYIFQEVLSGPEVTVDALFDLEGGLLVEVPRVRKRVDQGISVEGEVFESKELISMIRDMARILTFVGPINFQFMRKGDGFRMIEINARASGGTGITMKAGVDIPKLTLALLQKKTPKVEAARPGIYPNLAEVFERQQLKRERVAKL